MNIRPDEQTLISYVYGELGDKDKLQVEAYAKEHPDLLKELKAMSDTRDLLGAVGDKEVIVPSVFSGESNVRPLWQTTTFRVAVSIAASFLIVMVAGRLIGMEIAYGSGELKISFGSTHSPVQLVQKPGLAPED